MKGSIKIDREFCKGCLRCVEVCPKQLLEVSKKLNTKGYYPASFKEENINEDEERKCTACKLCAITCPDVAIEVYRE